MSTTAAGSTHLEPAPALEQPGVLEPTVPSPADGLRRIARHRTALGVLAITTLGLAAASIQQDPGPTPVAHFALVQSLSKGTAEIGPGVTVDSAYIDGKYFANKAPGLAFTLLPAYLGLRAAGLQQTSATDSGDGYRHRLWQLTLFGAVLPAVALMLLMLVAVDVVWPGYGALTAILLGAGTMLLPFATLLFGHMLSATLGFAAFVVLLLERQRAPSAWRAGVAGVLAGSAVVVEYPLAIVALALLGYVAAGTQVPRRLAAYASGCLIGVVPLAAYNTWAFGSPTTLSYTNVLNAPSGSGPPTLGGGISTGFYGVALPDPRAALSLLFSEKGLLVVTPCASPPYSAFLPSGARGGARRRRSAPPFPCCSSPTTRRTTSPSAARVPPPLPRTGPAVPRAPARGRAHTSPSDRARRRPALRRRDGARHRDGPADHRGGPLDRRLGGAPRSRRRDVDGAL